MIRGCRLFCLVIVSAVLTGVGRADETADPAASRLLAQARAARAIWEKFPGFRATIEVNIDGLTSRGKVEVLADGGLRLEGLEPAADAWVRRYLGSIVAHRLGGGEPARDTPCAFGDKGEPHPLGRLVRVLNDELHSSYRIRDGRILEVNRQTKDRRFTISVLDSRPNQQGKFLTHHYIVSHWNGKTGELERVEGNQHRWVRVGDFDLPAGALSISSASAHKSGPISVRSFTLTDHQLTAAK